MSETRGPTRYFHVRAASALDHTAQPIDDLFTLEQIATFPELEHYREALSSPRFSRLLLTLEPATTVQIQVVADVMEIGATTADEAILEALHVLLYQEEEQRPIGMIAVLCPTCQKLLHRPAHKMEQPGHCPRCLTEVA